MLLSLHARIDIPRIFSASGGIGLLAEHGGGDHYVSDVYGQGSAYWYAIGVLLDRGGRDFYQVYNYGQGEGATAATGGRLRGSSGSPTGMAGAQTSSRICGLVSIRASSRG